MSTWLLNVLSGDLALSNLEKETTSTGKVESVGGEAGEEVQLTGAGGTVLIIASNLTI